MDAAHLGEPEPQQVVASRVRHNARPGAGRRCSWYPLAVPLSVGDPVQRYVVERVNPDGTSYVVRHLTLGSRWLLKLVPTRGASHSASVSEAARRVARLAHPNVLRVFDWLDVDGQPAILCEHVEGPTLAELGAASLSPESALRIVKGILRGLQAAHLLEIVHGSLSPATIVLGPGENPRLCDFGLREPAPGFAPPEGGPPRPTHDLYGVAALLRWMFAGRPMPRAVAEAVSRGMAELPMRVPDVGSLWKLLTGTALPPPPPPVELPETSVPQTFPRLTPSHTALPSPRRPLLGRAAERDEMLERLSRDGTLLTVVGTAGVGKTRLALEVAHRFLRRGVGVEWVDMQGSSLVEDALTQIAWVLGDTTDGTAEAVGRSLARRGVTLLALDNLEQLPEEFGAVVARLLQLAPQLRVLGTSRQALGAPGERVLELQPLPHDEREPRSSEAWLLLVSAAPPGALDEVDDALARSLLAALEGLPLALELAAGRLEVLEPAQLLARIDDRFTVLSAPDAIGRHRGLYEALASSWEALTTDARRLLARLSVFAGSFDLAAAIAIADLPEVEVLLDELVRRSLVGRSRSRFHLLVTVREFAARELSAGERADAERRHARWYAQRGRRWSRADPDSLREVQANALELAAVLDRAERDHSLVLQAWSCVQGLALLHHEMGPLQLARQRLDRALQLPGGDEEERAALLLHRALVGRRQSQLQAALADVRWVLDRASRLPDQHVAAAYSNLANIYEETGPLEEALAAAEQGVPIARRAGLGRLLALLEISAGASLTRLGRASEARERHASAKAAIPAGDLFTELDVQRSVGWCELYIDALQEARGTFQRVIVLAQRLGRTRTMLTATGQLGLIAEAEGRLEDAQSAYQTVVDGMHRWGDPSFEGYYRGMVGRVLLRSGRREEALQWLDEAARLLGDAPFSGLIAMMRALALAMGGQSAGRCPEGWRPAVQALAGAVQALERGERAEAQEKLASIVAPPQADMLDRTLLEGLAASVQAGLDSWWFAPDGHWLEPPGAPRITLGEGSPRASILAVLLQRRLDSPGTPVGAAELVAAGWPGERIVAKAAANRLHVALSDLRRCAPLPYIERGQDGWHLHPELPVRLFGV
jgi:predicted ATPase